MNRNLKHAASLLVLAVTASACDSGLTSVNQNPNQPERVAPEYLFPQAATSIAEIVRGDLFDLTFTGLWAQHYAKIQYVDEDRYDVRPGNIDGWWAQFYSGTTAMPGPLMDLQKTIEIAEGEPGIVGPATVLRAFTFGTMTDVWGDIPYSEALQGDQAGASVTPAYDSQQEVYDGILQELADASALLATASNALGSADPIYGGDPAAWRKFANSLRARHGMRLSEVDAARARAEVTAALADGVFASNDDNAVLQWPGDGSNDHPFYTNSRTRDDHRVSATMVDTLKALADPRLAVYAQKAKDTGEYLGVPNGLTNANALAMGLSKTSKLGTFFMQPTSPSFYMTYAEVLFIEAEAAARGWTGGDAAALYAAAITASMEQFGVPAAAIAAYLAQPRVQYNPATGLQQIALQKWIALFGQGTEAYAEVRRTDVPTLTPGPAAITNGAFALRLTYPLAEQSTNKANVNAAMSAQEGATLTTPVWWDK